MLLNFKHVKIGQILMGYKIDFVRPGYKWPFHARNMIHAWMMLNFTYMHVGQAVMILPVYVIVNCLAYIHA